MTEIWIAKLGPLNIAELKCYGFIPSMRCWQNGRDITDELPVFKRWRSLWPRERRRSDADGLAVSRLWP
jgi:hypothetical protein